MSPELTFDISSVEDHGDTSIVEMSVASPKVMPDFVVKNRARVKAIRIVGPERIAVGGVEEIMDGNLSRVTEILEHRKTPAQPPGFETSDIVIEVITGE